VANPQEDGLYAVGLAVRPDLEVSHIGELQALMAAALATGAQT
jgi:hypothetical protein